MADEAEMDLPKIETKYSDGLGGVDLEGKLKEAVKGGVPPYLVGSLLEVVWSEVGDSKERRRIGKKMIAFMGFRDPRGVGKFAELLFSTDEPDEVILVGAFSGIKMDEMKSILAGIGSGLDDSKAKERIAASFSDKTDEIRESLVPDSRPDWHTKVPKQVEAIAACIRAGKSSWE